MVINLAGLYYEYNKGVICILKSINKSNYKKLMLGASVMLGMATLGVVSNNTQADASTRNGNVITVESGDTLSEIATTYNTSVDQLVNDNNIADKNVISVGQQLTLIDTNNSQTTNTNTQPASVSQPVQNTTTPTPTQNSSLATTNTTTDSSNLSSSEQEAKNWIAQRESGGSYTAQNGNYVGKYQLSSSYLNGDTSAANQEKVADEYCVSRYGSWVNAKNFWLTHNFW